MPPRRTDKRRTIVRNCSRKWRETEADLMAEMAALLPFPEEVKNTLNKPAVLRLCTTMIRARNLGVNQMSPPSDALVDLMDGFCITLDYSGLILYVSPQVQKTLGYASHEMLGLNIKEFLYGQDAEIFEEKVKPSLKNADSSINQEVNCVIRLKYKIVSSLNKTRQTGYVAMQLKGVIKWDTPSEEGTPEESSPLLILACYPVLMEPNIEIYIYEATFAFKFDINLQPLYVPDSVNEYFGFDIKSIMGKIEELSWVTDHHMQAIDASKNLLCNRGLLEATVFYVTQTGYMYRAYGRTFVVLGPKGEKQFCVCYYVVLSRQKVRVLRPWPEDKAFLACVDTYGIPGETQTNLHCDPEATMCVKAELVEPETDMSLNMDSQGPSEQDSIIPTWETNSLWPRPHSDSSSDNGYCSGEISPNPDISDSELQESVLSRVSPTLNDSCESTSDSIGSLMYSMNGTGKDSEGNIDKFDGITIANVSADIYLSEVFQNVPILSNSVLMDDDVTMVVDDALPFHWEDMLSLSLEEEISEEFVISSTEDSGQSVSDLDNYEFSPCTNEILKECSQEDDYLLSCNRELPQDLMEFLIDSTCHKVTVESSS